MEDSATKAAMGRSSLHRIENSSGTRPQAVNLSRLLRSLNITADEVAPYLPDDDPRWRRQLDASMRTPGGVVRTALRAARTPESAASIDLLAYRADPNNTVTVSVHPQDESSIVEVDEALTALGYVVART